MNILELDKVLWKINKLIADSKKENYRPALLRYTRWKYLVLQALPECGDWELERYESDFIDKGGKAHPTAYYRLYETSCGKVFYFTSQIPLDIEITMKHGFKNRELSYSKIWREVVDYFRLEQKPMSQDALNKLDEHFLKLDGIDVF